MRVMKRERLEDLRLLVTTLEVLVHSLSFVMRRWNRLPKRLRRSIQSNFANMVLKSFDPLRPLFQRQQPSSALQSTEGI